MPLAADSTLKCVNTPGFTANVLLVPASGPPCFVAVIANEPVLLIVTACVVSTPDVNAAVGDVVTEGEPILELETDKATGEVEAPASGRLAETLVQTGQTVEPGRVVGRIAPQ